MKIVEGGGQNKQSSNSWDRKSRRQGKGGAKDARDGGGGLEVATLDCASRNGMSMG
jgi:hypothetical protein